MPACPGGAEPLPGISAGTVILSLTQTALGDVAGLVAGFWGELAVQPILMRMSLQNLCDLNPDDPGPPSANDLAAITSMLAPFAGTSLSGQFPSWLLKQVQYHYFSVSCRCIQPVETIPPRQPVSPPPNEPPWPTAPGDQTQITRIENTQKDHFDALTTLYNGEMELNAQIGDLSWYIRPNFVGTAGHPLATISGEGHLTLAPGGLPGEFLAADMVGVRVLVDTLPTKYKVRGTVVPRYYGIGSVMWLTSDPQSGVDSVSERVSIHYRNQVVQMPPHAFHPRLAYRLMPGAVARIQQINRSVTGAWYGNQGWDERALLRLDQDVPPAGWTDSPFYPPPAARARQFALGSPP